MPQHLLHIPNNYTVLQFVLLLNIVMMQYLQPKLYVAYEQGNFKEEDLSQGGQMIISVALLTWCYCLNQHCIMHCMCKYSKNTASLF